MIVGYEDYKMNYDFSDVRGVIHVGAHHGQEHEAYLTEYGRNITTHWFEPSADAFAVLKTNLSHDKEAELYNFALGAASGSLPLWTETANGGQSSSLAKPVEITELWPHLEFVEGDVVEVRTLDSFGITNANMMVLDVQGYELEVLKGAVETLSRVDHVFCEVNNIVMYEGCPNLQSLCDFLSPLGFELKEIWWVSDSWGDGYWKKTKPKPTDAVKYTQYDEEGVILDYFKDGNPSELAFLDIGANDGVSYSNSRRIAIDGWKGVCLEPSPSAYNKLLALYADSTNVYPVNYGISDVSGEFEFHDSGNWNGRDDTPPSILGTLDPEQKKRFSGMTWSVIKCNFVTFDEFIKDSPIQKFDFISIDVEGHDWTVLKQIDLGAIGCQLICLEYNSEDYRLGLYEGYCQAYGMTEIYRNEDNVIYAVKG